MVYLFAIFLGVGAWFLVKHFSRNEEFLKKPIAEQQEIKKKILWGVYSGLAIGCLLAWLMQNGITSWARHLVIVVYLLIWAGGVYLIWLAYVFGVRKDTARIRKSDGKAFNNQQGYLQGFAITNLVCGCALMLIAIAIPLMGIQLKNWGALIFIVLGVRKFVTTQFEKSDSTPKS